MLERIAYTVQKEVIKVFSSLAAEMIKAKILSIFHRFPHIPWKGRNSGTKVDGFMEENNLIHYFCKIESRI